METILRVRILRSESDQTKGKRYETYAVHMSRKMSLLEVLERIYHQEPSLTFGYSCRIGKCGSCTVRLNGRPVLACQHIVDGEELTVEPIDNFPVIRDLLVDRNRIDSIVGESFADFKHDRAILPDSRIPYKSLTWCINCLACDSVCPVLKAAPDMFTGPATTAALAGPGPRVQNDGTVGIPVGKSMDFCSFCLNCESVCPANVELDKLNAEAKSAYFSEKGRPLHDKIVGRIGKLGKIVSYLPARNTVQKSKTARWFMEKVLGFDRRFELPEFTHDFEDWMRGHRSLEKGGRKVAYFAGCFARYMDADVGRATVEILEHNGVVVKVPEQQCCGLPLMSKGDLKAVRKLAEDNLRIFKQLVADGYDVVATCTSCSWMLKHGYSQVLELEEADEVAKHSYDLGEYILKMKDAGQLRTDFGTVDLTFAYHAPCHLKSQKIGKPFLEIMTMVPGLKAIDITKDCCGLSGTYGFKKQKYDIAMSVGKELFESVKASGASMAVSECGTCRLQIEHGTGTATVHPVVVLQQSYNKRGRIK